MSAVDRIALLELDIDCRIGADLWAEASSVAEWDFELVAAYMRASFGRGYCEALTEPKPGGLCSLHGYRVPERRKS